MDIFRPFRRCFACGGRKDLDRLHNGTIYSEHWRYFHRSCLSGVLRYPESFDSNVVDKGIEIEGLIRDQEERRRRALEGRRQQLDEARLRYHRLQQTRHMNADLVELPQSATTTAQSSIGRNAAAIQNINNEPIIVNCTMNLESFKSKVSDSQPETPMGKPVPPNSRYDLLRGKPQWPEGRTIKEADEWKGGNESTRDSE